MHLMWTNMTRAGRILNESQVITYDDFPTDMQEWLLSFVEQYGDDEAWEKLHGGYEFEVMDIPTSYFPNVEELAFFEHIRFDETDELTSQLMIGKNLPPVIICDGILVDGFHRVWAAQYEGKQSVQAIDISQLGEYLVDNFLKDSETLAGMTDDRSLFEVRNRE